MSLITVIGRGHSGTRAMSHTLGQSGVYMGAELNESGDLVPPDAMYEACRVIATHVRHIGGLRWDFAALQTMPIDPAFIRLIESYLNSVLDSDAEHRGWKIPETILVFPWLVRLFPDISYIYWVRDPRDCIAGYHVTDDLSDFSVPWDRTDDCQLSRAVSWMYQVAIVRATPLPANWITVRFEDFVLSQDTTLARLEDYLAIPLARIPVWPDVIGKWKTSDKACCFDFFADELKRFGY